MVNISAVQKSPYPIYIHGRINKHGKNHAVIHIRNDKHSTFFNEMKPQSRLETLGSSVSNHR